MNDLRGRSWVLEPPHVFTITTGKAVKHLFYNCLLIRLAYFSESTTRTFVGHLQICSRYCLHKPAYPAIHLWGMQSTFCFYRVTALMRSTQVGSVRKHLEFRNFTATHGVCRLKRESTKRQGLELHRGHCRKCQTDTHGHSCSSSEPRKMSLKTVILSCCALGT